MLGLGSFASSVCALRFVTCSALAGSALGSFFLSYLILYLTPYVQYEQLQVHKSTRVHVHVDRTPITVFFQDLNKHDYTIRRVS